MVIDSLLTELVDEMDDLLEHWQDTPFIICRDSSHFFLLSISLERLFSSSLELIRYSYLKLLFLVALAIHITTELWFDGQMILHCLKGCSNYFSKCIVFFKIFVNWKLLLKLSLNENYIAVFFWCQSLSNITLQKFMTHNYKSIELCVNMIFMLGPLLLSLRLFLVLSDTYNTLIFIFLLIFTIIVAITIIIILFLCDAFLLTMLLFPF